MEFFKAKQDLEKYLPQDLDLLARHYDINAKNKNDRLWLLAISILSLYREPRKKYAQMIMADIEFDDYFEEIK